MASLEGKVIIITGGSAGIGKCIAVNLAPYKPKLVLAARGTAGLEATRVELQGIGLPVENTMPLPPGKLRPDPVVINAPRQALGTVANLQTNEPVSTILTVQCDVSKDDNLENLVDTTIKTFGSIYGLVNNAGLSAPGNVEEVDMKVYDTIMGVNLRAPFYLSKLCIPYLRRSKGCVINMSSIASKGLMTEVAPYCISKAGLDHFTHLLAAETGPSGVRVNSVNPGYTKTDFVYTLGLSEEEKIKFEAGHAIATPLRRVAESEDVAKLVKFLLSDDASYITGEIICIDGGRAIHRL